MSRKVSRFAGRLSAIALAAALGGPQIARAELPCIVGCFSVSGKKGVYVTTVDVKQLNDARLALKGGVGGDGKGVGEHSINKGEYTGAGLPMRLTEAKLQAMVDEIRAKVVETWPEMDPGPVSIHIVGSTTYGPRAQADNVIVVPLGLLLYANSDDEVAWVLSHELSHLSLAHFARNAAAEKRRATIDSAVGVVVTGLEISRIRAQNTGSVEGVRFYAANDPKTAKHESAAKSLQQNIRRLISLQGQAVSRDQEDRADAAGADFALAAGYDVEDAAAAAYAKIKQDDDNAAAMSQSMGDQFQRLATDSVDTDTVNAAKQGNLNGALSGYIKSLERNAGALVVQRMIVSLSSSHRPTAQRQAGLRNYIREAYKDMPDRETKTAWLDGLRAAREFADAKAVVTAHTQAEGALAQDLPDEALSDLQPAFATVYANTPYVANMAAKIYGAMGNVAEADRRYDLAENPPVAAVVKTSAPVKAAPSRKRKGAPARAAPPAAVAPLSVQTADNRKDPYLQQSLDGYHDHVALLASHAQYAKAKLKIAEAEIRFHDHERFLPDMIFVAIKTSDNEGAQAALDECRRVQEDALWEQCKLAILDEGQKALLDKMSPVQKAKFDKSMERSVDDNQRASTWKKSIDTINKSAPTPTAN